MTIYFTNVGYIRYKIKHVLEGALKYLKQPSRHIEMSLSVVSPEEIRKLNEQFRGVDAVTDVLSFPTLDLGKQQLDHMDLPADAVNVKTGKLNIGDVIICFEKAKEQAREYGHSLKREICFLALHGLLHLLGYDHIEPSDEEEMNHLQEEILAKLHIKRETKWHKQDS